jgi:hypothetical protein
MELLGVSIPFGELDIYRLDFSLHPLLDLYLRSKALGAADICRLNSIVSHFAVHIKVPK